MKKILCVLLALAMLLSFTACDSEPEVELNVPEGKPTYADDKELELYAYAGPRSGGYRWNVDGQTHPDDPAGGWDSFITEKDFQDYIDCGFTFLYPEYDAEAYRNAANLQVPFEQSTLYEYMSLAEKMNIDVVVQDDTVTQLTRGTSPLMDDDMKAYVKQLIDDLSTFECFKGLTLADEPKVNNYRIFEQVTNFARSVKADIELITCMLPVYGAPHLNVGTGTTADYQGYIDDYGKLDGHFIYDFYPLRWSPVAGNYLKRQWFQNLEMVANSSKTNGFETGVVIQSCAYGGVGNEGIADHARSVLTQADVGYQLYTSLAYGAKTIGYFTYWQHRSEGHPHITESFYDGMVMYPKENGMESVKTDTYYAVKAANLEVKKFDHVLMSFDWEGTIGLKGTDKFKTMIDIPEYTNPRIAEATSTEDAIIGCLKDANGYDGFMIVNALEPSLEQSVSVTVKFREASSAIAYVNGEETEIQLEDGSYTFNLDAGAGVFVIPIK